MQGEHCAHGIICIDQFYASVMDVIGRIEIAPILVPFRASIILLALVLHAGALEGSYLNILNLRKFRR